MTSTAYRHGDLCLVKIDGLPLGLTVSDSKVLMTGSGGNDHIFDHGLFYPKDNDDFVIGYLETPEGGTNLYHPDHGRVIDDNPLRVAHLPTGIYELRKQQEYTHKGMQPVED